MMSWLFVTKMFFWPAFLYGVLSLLSLCVVNVFVMFCFVCAFYCCFTRFGLCLSVVITTCFCFKWAVSVLNRRVFVFFVSAFVGAHLTQKHSVFCIFWPASRLVQWVETLALRPAHRSYRLPEPLLSFSGFCFFFAPLSLHQE